MVGLGEVPPTNSKGAADFHGTISSDGTTITYTLNGVASRPCPCSATSTSVPPR
jgi:hypothetical protein